MTIPAGGGPTGDQGAGEVDEGQVVRRFDLPPDAQSTIEVVPTIGSLDDPPPRFTLHAAQRRLAAPSDVGEDATDPDLAFGVGVVVALVKAEVVWTSATAPADRHGVQRLAYHPLVVDVGAAERHPKRDAASVGDDVTLDPALGTIRRVGTREVPPFGAFTMALSSEAQSQAMPRSSS